MRVDVTEGFKPLGATTEAAARRELDALRSSGRDNPEVHYRGIVETWTLGDEASHTTAKWCAVVATAKRR